MSDACVLVVGGTRGVGRLIALLLHERGYRARVLARDAAKAAAELGPSFDVVAGDLTKPGTLPAAVRGADHIVFTAGTPSGRYASEHLVKLTDHDGVVETLAAAREAGFRGRFLYLNSIGIATPSPAATFINLLKRNTLLWRRRVEDVIRMSGVDYTIIRVGFLLNRPGGQRAIVVDQNALALAPCRRIARADVAQAFVEALPHRRASRATFEIVWGTGPPRDDWNALFARLTADAPERADQRTKTRTVWAALRAPSSGWAVPSTSRARTRNVVSPTSVGRQASEKRRHAQPRRGSSSARA
jgi:uncharacterized protein YbjT (DUF2867 family)